MLNTAKSEPPGTIGFEHFTYLLKTVNRVKNLWSHKAATFLFYFVFLVLGTLFNRISQSKQLQFIFHCDVNLE